MKCPILALIKFSTEGKFVPKVADCLKGECAWWSPNGNICSITSLSEELHWAAERLNAIAMRMPHEEQFRK
ncbi:hypothetical protein ES703_15120 [subsurface metagenome]